MLTPSNHLPISTTPAANPYWARLQAVSGRFEEVDVLVRDHVVIDACRIVRNASGDGFWYLPTNRSSVAGGEPPLALFQPHPNTSFSFPAR